MSLVKEQDGAYIEHTYGRFDVVLTHGIGAIVFDEQERSYIDLTAGIGVNSLGFAHPKWVAAISAQAASLPHVSNLYYTKPDTEVAKQLCQRTGFQKMIFSNSGAEANEAAIKLARKYSFDHYGKDRYEIITLVNSFHGRTITTLSATGQDSFHQYFDPFTPGFVHAIANDIEDMKQKINSKTCAVFLELIQGEGGVLPLDKAYVKQVEALCQEHDILLMIDEVQTGVGRCGSLYAYEQFDLHPDAITTAKGLGNGLPIGGVLLNQKLEGVFAPGDHGSTFAGNPIACAGAEVVLTELDEAFLKEVVDKGDYLKQRVLQMPHVLGVNGMGLMRGIVLDNITAKDVVVACMEKGVLLLTAKDKLRMLPPLTITMEQLTQALDVLENVLTHWEE